MSKTASREPNPEFSELRRAFEAGRQTAAAAFERGEHIDPDWPAAPDDPDDAGASDNPAPAELPPDDSQPKLWIVRSRHTPEVGRYELGLFWMPACDGWLDLTIGEPFDAR